MASNEFTAELFRTDQQQQVNGHDICYNLALINLASLQDDWTFRKYYFTPCQSLPTSWRFQLTLQRVPGSEEVSGYATLIRNDSINIPVNAHFVVTFYYMNYSADYVPRTNIDRRMVPTDVKSIYMYSIVPSEFRPILHQQLLVRVLITIRNCHGERTSSGSKIESKEKPVHFSKL
ncbi:hypothetical protein HNY73_021826 [Argiope bruennichi]|uniref:Uncharacterized protein n=1 Tax=Argiope bruennichi TaxID=94029 RepID=A0A8T0DYR6_ARGBR|nr:hypothetical protein HNY73_021826 [Argiope bruennichi]